VARESTPEAAFHRAIFDRPGDPLPVLIYADWLDERGDPRGSYLRRFPGIYQVIARLKTTGSPGSVPIVPAGPSEADRPDFIYGLVLVMLEHRWDDGFNTAVPGIIDATLSEIARRYVGLSSRDFYEFMEEPGIAPLRSLVRLLRGRPPIPADQARFAENVAEHRSGPELEAFLDEADEDPRSIEFWACLLQEAVIRSADLSGRTAPEAIRRRLRTRGHPLASLPLRKLEPELNGLLWLVNDRTWYDVPRLDELAESRQMLDPLSLSPGQVEGVEVTASGEVDAMLSAFTEAGWFQTDARVFRLARAVDDVSSILGGLALPYWDASGWAMACGTDLSEVLRTLFFDARAFQHGPTGAYARLKAWQSVAGMVGQPIPLNPDELAKTECQWAAFDGQTGWFHGARRVGLACLRPDGRTVAVVAAIGNDD